MKAFLVFAFVQTILLVIYIVLYIRQTIRQLAGRLYKSIETRQELSLKGRQKRG